MPNTKTNTVEDGQGNIVSQEIRPFTSEELNKHADYAREKDYEDAGWVEPWDLLDDILDQLALAGITLQVKIDRDTIKSTYIKS